MSDAAHAIEIEEDESAANATMIANEEYKIWKKHSPFLYDVMVTTALDWPSLTCQWFPDKVRPEGKNYIRHRLLLGTHTSGQERNYLQIAEVQLPTGEEQLPAGKYDDDKGEIGSYGGASSRIKVIQKINHDGEVNRARYCPQNIDLIATRAVSGLTYIFDRTKHSLIPNADGVCRPDIILEGQTKEGYGLDWNPIRQGHILASSDDSSVCYWDINEFKKGSQKMQPVRRYEAHTSIVEDVAWHHHHESLFASVGDDRQMFIWDSRSNTPAPKHRVEAHTAEVNAVRFSPSNEFLLATASSDKSVGLWDLRNLKVKLHSLESHTDEVLQLSWSPHNETVLASASADRRINLWDLSRIGEEQTPDDAEDGPPELLFVHGGHTSRPTDLSWCPSERWHMCSTSEDNVCMLWSVTATIVDETNVPDDELE
ncbi:unnamed protein product [Tilletia controversa]|uniref:Histone acetyltransferase type B subunit 2 n=3 Tax=Tilletia TaxID=13289 RepID=A0A8X7MSG9_9BASI|nr:hypothetical protein CF336_g4837 [Tilletia laevis]KAE8195543.1 hypothetical protein CF328_g4403 [Tilletia controversa]KAE8259270.1 hypothetical protein A4X03_0g4136 [Tilletia caries]KAE8199774.1 hypothetical protein CF335_g4093 [Tilletia laevis]KAE8246101.1 hypothetical protein A4X06_0g5185 [Tilletia controversa]